MGLFNRVRSVTPESVELEFRLAGIGRRVLAIMLDYSIIALVLCLFWLIWIIFSTQFLIYMQQWGWMSGDAPLWLIAILVLVTFFFCLGYFAVFETIWQGQTPGKRAAQIRVVRDDGQPIGMSQAALRSLLRLIDDLTLSGIIGVLMIYFGKQEKRLGDWVAGTMVIQTDRGVKQVALALSTGGQDLATQLPETAQLAELLPDDFATIREFLQRRSMMTREARQNLSTKLAGQAQRLVKLEIIPPKYSAEEFLEALYGAYLAAYPERDLG
jgi:uncharacterized RDD family membrane protein YckC